MAVAGIRMPKPQPAFHFCAKEKRGGVVHLAWPGEGALRRGPYQRALRARRGGIFGYFTFTQFGDWPWRGSPSFLLYAFSLNRETEFRCLLEMEPAPLQQSAQ